MPEMVSHIADTDRSVRQQQVEHWRSMTVQEKFAEIAGLNELVEAMVMAGLRRQFPEADESTLRRRLAERRYGVDLVNRLIEISPARTR